MVIRTIPVTVQKPKTYATSPESVQVKSTTPAEDTKIIQWYQDILGRIPAQWEIDVWKKHLFDVKEPQAYADFISGAQTELATTKAKAEEAALTAKTEADRIAADAKVAATQAKIDEAISQATGLMGKPFELQDWQQQELGQLLGNITLGGRQAFGGMATQMGRRGLAGSTVEAAGLTGELGTLLNQLAQAQTGYMGQAYGQELGRRQAEAGTLLSGAGMEQGSIGQLLGNLAQREGLDWTRYMGNRQLGLTAEERAQQNQQYQDTLNYLLGNKASPLAQAAKYGGFGATAGAGIGSIIPGVGTLLGGLVGGGLGALYGGFGGT